MHEVNTCLVVGGVGKALHLRWRHGRLPGTQWALRHGCGSGRADWSCYEEQLVRESGRPRPPHTSPQLTGQSRASREVRMEAQAAVGAPARCDAVLPLGRSESPTLVVEAVRHAVVSSNTGVM